MKKIKELSIFSFFIIVFLLRGTIDAILLNNIKEPNIDETLLISNQNLESQLKNLESQLKIAPNIENKIYSKLLYRDILSFNQTITILKGEKEGIKENMAVLQDNNLIGIIIEVQEHQSKVKLLKNPTTNISVKLNGAYGTMSGEENENWVVDFSKNIEVKEHDMVTTSGLTEIPANIPIGTVESIQKDELGLIQKIKIKLFANFDEIYYVTVLGSELKS